MATRKCGGGHGWASWATYFGQGSAHPPERGKRTDSEDLVFQITAFGALQEACESHLVNTMFLSGLCAENSSPSDTTYIMRIETDDWRGFRSPCGEKIYKAIR